MKNFSKAILVAYYAAFQERNAVRHNYRASEAAQVALVKAASTVLATGTGSK